MIRRLLTLLVSLALISLPGWSMQLGGPMFPGPGMPAASGGGGSNPAYVTGNSALQTNGTSAAVTISVSAGQGVFVYCLAVAACTTPTSTGATETFATATGTSGCQNFGGDDVQCWYVASAVGGDTAINCTTGSTAEIFCDVGTFTRPQGLATPNDAGGNGYNAASTGYSVSTSAATTNANDIVWACFGGYGANFTSGITITGFTMPAAMQGTYGGCGYKIVGSTGTQTAAGSWSTSQRATGVIMAFKP